MPAVRETVDTGPPDRRRPVQIRFRHRHRDRTRRPRASREDTVRFISAKKGEPEWMLEWRLDAYRRWLTMNEPTWARVHYPKIDFQDIYYYAAPKADGGAQEPRRGRSRAARDLREARHPAARARGAGRRRGRRGSRSTRCSIRVSVVTTFKEELAEGRRHLLLDLRGDPRASGAGAEVSRLGRADHRQFLRHAELGGLLRRLVRLRAGGRALPDGAVDLFPHQRAATPASSSAR